jgi:hypothetical protein
MNGVKRTAVGRKTRRAPDSVFAFQQIRLGFEPGLCSRSEPVFDANTSKARLKPGAVDSVTIQRFERAEVFADSTELAEVLPVSSNALRP